MKDYNYITPEHYRKEDGRQTIDLMIEEFGIAETIAFCKLNAFKYADRKGKKPGEDEEREKAKEAWYKNKEQELSNIIEQTQTKTMKVKIINKSNHPLPSYAKVLDAGMDLRANLIEAVSLTPMQRALIPTGIFIQLPAGFEAQIRPRSGLAYKHGITVLNSPGTVN